MLVYINFSILEMSNSMIKKKLLDILVERIRFKHYSRSTEETYRYWCKDYILYHNKKHPKEMGKDEIE